MVGEVLNSNIDKEMKKKIKIPKEFKKKIQEFRESIIEWVNKGASNYHDVYQLNLHLFPSTISNIKTKKV